VSSPDNEVLAATPAPPLPELGIVYAVTGRFNVTHLFSSGRSRISLSHFEVVENMNRSITRHACLNAPAELKSPTTAIALLRKAPLPCVHSKQQPLQNGILIQDVTVNAGGKIVGRGNCYCIVPAEQLPDFKPLASAAAASPVLVAVDGGHASSTTSPLVPPMVIPPISYGPLVPRFFAITKTINPSNCPCLPKSNKIPKQLTLPALDRKYWNVKQFGENITYRLVDPDGLPEGLRPRTIRVKKTGYSRATNSPSGSEFAGWAAIRKLRVSKSEIKGLATLGSGTLDRPTTVAISPELARNYGVCQGDLLYDERQGWLRIEGGCTQAGLSLDGTAGRVDIWRGSGSVDAVNGIATMTHFPAALVDADFARGHPGPARASRTRQSGPLAKPNVPGS